MSSNSDYSNLDYTPLVDGAVYRITGSIPDIEQWVGEKIIVKEHEPKRSYGTVITIILPNGEEFTDFEDELVDSLEGPL